MKKLVLVLAVAFSASLFSCGSSEKAEAADSAKVDSVEAVAPADSVVAPADSAAAPADSAAAPAEAPAAE